MKFLDNFPNIAHVIDSAISACAHGARTRNCKTNVELSFEFLPVHPDHEELVMVVPRMTTTIGSVWGDPVVFSQEFCELPVTQEVDRE